MYQQYQQYDTSAQHLVKFGEIMRLSAIFAVITFGFAVLTLISMFSMIFGPSDFDITEVLFYGILLIIVAIIVFIIEIVFLVRLHKAAEWTNSRQLHTAFQWYIAAIIIPFVLGLFIQDSTINYALDGGISFSIYGLIKDVVSVGLNFMAVSDLYKWSVETYQIEKDPLLNEVSRGFQFQRIGVILGLIPFIDLIGSVLVLIGQFKAAKNLINAYQAHEYHLNTPTGQSQRTYTQPQYSQPNSGYTSYSIPPQNPVSLNIPTQPSSPTPSTYDSPQMNNPPVDTNMIKICPACGSSVPKDAKFCYQCGHLM